MSELDLDSLLKKHSKNDGDDVCASVTMVDLEAEPEIFKTGIPQFDALLGGGMHWGRLTEIFGPNKSGKTELARFISATVLKNDPDTEVWYFDQEFALSPEILRNYPELSLKNAAGKPRFRPLTVSCLEEFFKLIYRALKLLDEINRVSISKGKLAKKVLFVLDSVPALKAKAELENEEFEKSSLLPGPRIWSSETSKLRRYMSHVGAHTILVNQIRDKPGSASYMDPESPGGQAIKFYADYRFYMRSTGKFSFSKGRAVPKGKRSSGFFSTLTVKKNKTGIPDREIEFPITFTPALGKPSGISQEWALFYSLLSSNVIKSRGGKFWINGIEDGFSRLEWVSLYDEMINEPSSPIMAAMDKWIDVQLSNDISKVTKEDSGDDDDDDSGEE